MTTENQNTTTEAASLPTPGMEEFVTRLEANIGKKLELYTSDGRLTAHWLQVRGIDSDAFRQEKTKQTRRMAATGLLPKEEQPGVIADAALEMVVSLVAGWSFDKPFTHDNVKLFLQDAPQIVEEVDKFASRRTFFFKRPLAS